MRCLVVIILKVSNAEHETGICLPSEVPKGLEKLKNLVDLDLRSNALAGLKATTFVDMVEAPP